MAISVNWATKIVTIPQADLTLISGTIYEADTDDVRLDLKALESSEEGMPYLDITQHNTEVSVAGVTYARVIEIINGYQIQFEDGQYTVILKGSNNNIFDVENGVLVQNQVQVIPTNSGGLIVVTQGSGVTSQDKTDIIDGVWDETLGEHVAVGSTGEALDNVSGGSSPATIASAVWDIDMTTHQSAGTSGGRLMKIPILGTLIAFFKGKND